MQSLSRIKLTIFLVQTSGVAVMQPLELSYWWCIVSHLKVKLRTSCCLPFGTFKYLGSKLFNLHTFTFFVWSCILVILKSMIQIFLFPNKTNGNLVYECEQLTLLLVSNCYCLAMKHAKSSEKLISNSYSLPTRSPLQLLSTWSAT